MQITILNNNSGKKTLIQTQQYMVGLYIIEDNDPQKQYGLNCTEQEFMDMLHNNPNITVLN